MKSIQPIVQIFLAVIIILPSSLIILRRGWLCLRFGIGELPIPQHIGLLILKGLKGKEAAAKRKNELIDQQKRRSVGRAEIVGGIIFLLIAIIFCIEAILRL